MDIQLVSSFSTTVSVLQMKKKKKKEKKVSASAKHLEKHLWPVSHGAGEREIFFYFSQIPYFVSISIYWNPVFFPSKETLS